MKHLELNLNKRLLIVEDAEYGSYFPPRSVGYHIEKDGEVWKLLCKGSDITEDIAKEFIPIDEKEARIKYPKAFLISYKRFQNAFIDVIESNGWYWGENPLDKVDPENRIYESDLVLFDDDLSRWQEAQSKTFKPEKCLIFEIV